MSTTRYAKFKKGDKVIVSVDTDEKSYPKGSIWIIDQDDNDCPWIISDISEKGDREFCLNEDRMELYDGSPLINNNAIALFDGKAIVKKPMNTLINTVKNMFRTEPEKSFIKLGILDESMTLTAEGRLVFIDYLFSQNKEAFNKDVVTPLLAQIKEDNK